MIPRDPKAIEAWLAGREASVANLRPGAEKRVIWAGDPGAVTDLSVVFVHGFSATAEEIRPVPDLVAQALGANLHFTRLSGHGRDGAAMAEPTLVDWEQDVDEALTIARTIGRRVLVISCSTGGPLVALAAAKDPAGLAGMVYVSPNFRLKSRIARWLLNAPGIWSWGPILLGKERRFEPHSPDHAAHWTTSYPTVSVRPMVHAIRAFARCGPGRVKVPALAVIADADRVVDAAYTRRIIGKWGAPARVAVLTMTDKDDTNAHVIAGDILSPAQTHGAVQKIVTWFQAQEKAS